MYFNPHSYRAEYILKPQYCDFCKKELSNHILKCRICKIKVHSECAFNHVQCQYSNLNETKFQELLLNIKTDLGNWYYRYINWIVYKLEKHKNILKIINNFLLDYKTVLLRINFETKSEFYQIGKKLILKTFYQVIMTEFEKNTVQYSKYIDDHQIKKEKIIISNIEKISAKKTPTEKCDLIYEMMNLNEVQNGDHAIDMMIQCVIQSSDKINWRAEFLFIKRFLVDNDYKNYCLVVLESALEYIKIKSIDK